MKWILGWLGGLAAILAIVFSFSPARAEHLVFRARHFFDEIPPVEKYAGPPPTTTPPALGSGATTPPWKEKDREADRAYMDGDFLAAGTLWLEASRAAPVSDASRLRDMARQANIFWLLAGKTAVGGGGDRAADEAELRKRIDSLKSPTAGSWLEIADFAVARGLSSHLAFLYEKAYEKRATVEGDAVQAKVLTALKERKAGGEQAPPEVLDSVIQELPTSDAAEVAREQGGAAGGVGGVERNPRVKALKPQDQKKLSEANDLMAKGNEEYRKAVPGSAEVNKHRRAALDAFTKARALYEEVDRDSGLDAHQSEIHDCNRNIAELRKDLPIGK
jgi:hypothetical protein